MNRACNSVLEGLRTYVRVSYRGSYEHVPAHIDREAEEETEKKQEWPNGHGKKEGKTGEGVKFAVTRGDP